MPLQMSRCCFQPSSQPASRIDYHLARTRAGLCEQQVAERQAAVGSSAVDEQQKLFAELGRPATALRPAQLAAAVSVAAAAMAFGDRKQSGCKTAPRNWLL